MQKSTLLNVISILFIISGALGLFFSFVSFLGIIITWGVPGLISSLISVLSAALQMTAGILGIQKEDNLDMCKKLALLLIVLVIVNVILNIALAIAFVNSVSADMGGGIAVTIVTGMIALFFGLLLPILYMLGIRKSLNSFSL